MASTGQYWADQRHIPYVDLYELTGSVALRKYLDTHATRVNAHVNAHLTPFEQVKYYDVLADEFMVDNRLLTPTEKHRRKAVDARYREQLEASYPAVPVHAETTR